MASGDIHSISPQPNYEPIEVKVENGLICIGDRKFRVKIGNDVISSEELLDRAQSLLIKFFSEASLRETLGQPITIVQGTPRPKFRITFTAERATVERTEGGEVVSQLAFRPVANPEAQDVDYKTNLQEIHDQHAQTADYQKALMARLRKFPLAVQREAAIRLIQHGHIALRDVHEGKLPDSIDERTLNDVLQEYGNEALRDAVHGISTMELTGNDKRVSKREVRKCMQELRLFILHNLTRTPQVLETETCTYVQRFEKGVKSIGDHPGRIDELFVADKAWSSEGDRNKVKKGTCEFDAHANNLGAIHIHEAGLPSKCLLTRSGRTDDSARLKECVIAACVEQLKTSHPSGFTPNSDGSYTFQHVITSYLDHSILKLAEPGLLDNLVKAVKEWPPEGVRINVNGVEIVLKRPILNNQIFSPLVKGFKIGDKTVALSEAALDYGRTVSFIGNQELLARAMEKEGTSPSVELINASQRLATEAKLPLKKNGMIDFAAVSFQEKAFSGPLFQEYQQAVANFIREQKGPLWKALYAVSFSQLPHKGKVSLKPEAEYELHAADIEIYRNFLIGELNLSNGKQCMSGCDRTGIAVALSVAQDRFKRERGYDFFPPDSSAEMNHQDLILFKKFFRESLKTHAKEVTIQTKGVDGLRIFGGGGNPVLNKYLFLEEDGQGVTDVRGLTYADLFARGKRQYRGESLNPLLLGGQGQMSVVRSVERAQKRLAKNSEAIERANATLEGLLGQKGVLNDKLELAISAKKVKVPLAELKALHLAETIPEVKYALSLIINIQERREKAKQMRESDTLTIPERLAQGLSNLPTFVLEE